MRHHWRLVAWLAAISVFNAVSFYVMFVYVASWLQTADGISPAHALEINTASMFILLPVLVLSGWLSDRFGRRPILLISVIAALVVAVPLFWMMYHPSPALILMGQMGFGILIGLYYGAQAAAMVEAAPVAIRCTAVALGYNACLAVFGGLTPLVSAWLVNRTADQLAPAYLMMVAAAISLVVVWRMKRDLPHAARLNDRRVEGNRACFSLDACRFAGRAERAMERLDHLAHFGPRQRVVDILAVPPSLDQIVASQPRKLLRHRGLTQPERLFDLGHRFFAGRQQAENHQPRLMRQRLEKFARLTCIGDQRIEVDLVLGRLCPPLRHCPRLHRPLPSRRGGACQTHRSRWLRQQIFQPRPEEIRPRITFDPADLPAVIEQNERRRKPDRALKFAGEAAHSIQIDEPDR